MISKEIAIHRLENYNQPIYAFSVEDLKEAIDYLRSIKNELRQTNQLFLLDLANKVEQWLNSSYKGIEFKFVRNNLEE